MDSIGRNDDTVLHCIAFNYVVAFEIRLFLASVVSADRALSGL